MYTYTCIAGTVKCVSEACMHILMHSPKHKAANRRQRERERPERRSKEAPCRRRWRFHHHCTRRRRAPATHTKPCERASVHACIQPYNIITYTPNGPEETSDETRAHERRSAQASTHANKTTASPRRRTHKKEAIVKMPPPPPSLSSPTPTHRGGGGGDRGDRGDRDGNARHVRARARVAQSELRSPQRWREQRTRFAHT